MQMAQQQSPMALLTVASSRDDVTAERLVRATLLVARCLGDSVMVDWCRLELESYPRDDPKRLPPYRTVPATLMARDRFGRTAPAYFKDKPPEGVLETFLFQSIGEIEASMSGAGARGHFEV